MPSNFQLTKDKHDDGHQLAKLLTKSESHDNPDKFVQLAISEHLGPMLYYRLKNSPLVLRDVKLEETLATTAREVMAIYLLQERAMTRVNDVLTQAGIRCVWLKGGVLGHTVYPEPHLRVKGDLDCIVPVNQFEVALDILLRMDYIQLDLNLQTVFQDKLSHHEHLVHEQYPQIHIELHHRLLGYSGDRYLSIDHISSWLEQATDFNLNDQLLLTLKPEHHLLYLCAHGFLQHGEKHILLRDLLDLHLLMTTYKLDWKLITAEAIQLKWTYLVEYVLSHVQGYFDTPIPTEVFNELQAHQSTDEVVEHIILKRQGDIRGETVLQTLSQLSFPERLRTIWQLALPSKVYMRQRYHIDANQSTLPYYFYRIFDQLRGISISIWQRLIFRFRRQSE